MKHFMRTMSVVGTLALLLVACDSNYNFDKISLEVTIGDTEGITIPLGTTEKITIESLLGEQGELNTDKDGFYSFGMADSFTEEFEVGTIAPITGLAPTIAPTTMELMGEMNTSISPISQVQTIPYPEGLSGGITIPAFLAGQSLSLEYGPAVFENSFEIALPDHIKSIDKVTFGAGGSGSLVSITFDLAGLTPVSENRTINTFAIEAPAGFELAKVAGDPVASYATISKGSGSETNNRYEITNYPLNQSTVELKFLLMSAQLSGAATEGKVVVDNNISYSFSMGYTVKAGTTGTQTPSVKATADIAIHSATVTLDAWEQSFNLSEQFNQSVSLPKEVEAIDYLEIGRTDLASALPQLNVSLGLDGSPLGEINLSSLELTLPAILDVEAPAGWILSGNTLKATNLTLKNGSNNPIITLPLKGLKNIPIANGVAKIEGTLGVNATIAIAAGQQLSIDTSAKSITLTPSVAIDDLSIRSVVGRVNPDLGGLLAPIEVDLSELTSALGEDMELSLNLASPTIDLSVENPIGVGIDLVVKIDAWKGGVVTKSISTPTLTILGAEGTTPAITKISLTGDTPTEGQTKVEGLMELINSLPDKLVVTLDAAPNTSKPHTLIVKDSYLFKVDYSVGAALKFDAEKNGHINYTTLIEDIDLSEIVGSDIDIAIDSLTVNVEAQSTLPLDAVLRIKFLDAEKNEVSQIKALTTGSIKGSANDTPTESKISIGLTLPDATSSVHIGELLGSIKAVECSFEGETLAGAGLKPEQWLQATLSLCLDKGVTVDLGTLAPKDEPTDELSKEEHGE